MASRITSVTVSLATWMMVEISLSLQNRLDRRVSKMKKKKYMKTFQQNLSFNHLIRSNHFMSDIASQ